MSMNLYPAEFVFPGHPDKLSDAIADGLVAAATALEARALVGVEVAVHRDRVFVTGRIAAQGSDTIDVQGLVRDVYRTAGYGPDWRPGPEDLRVETDLCVGPFEDGESEGRVLSDDQAICVGYAIDRPEALHLPVEQWLVARLARRLNALRAQRPDLGLGPDGKVLVVVGEGASHHELVEFSCSLQQRAEADAIALHRAVRLTLEDEMATQARAWPGLSSRIPEQLTVNGAGAFEVGGPWGDNGLSGKKLVMDAYGPRVPIGGGAWSGKDFHKADRAGGLFARRLAKLMVATGQVKEATVTIAYAPGDRSARLLRVASDVPAGNLAERCLDLLDPELASSGSRWRDPGSLVEIARWGHFQDTTLPWEILGRR
jgi:S-adenosylmethionine synthetase